MMRAFLPGAACSLAACSLIAAPALAQTEQPPQKSVEEIRCELTGTCLDLGPSAAPAPYDTAEPAPAAAAATAADPAADPTADRGWNWGSRESNAATRDPAARPPAAPLVRPAPVRRPPQVAATPGVRPAGRTSSLMINFVSGSAQFTPDGRVQAERVFQAINSPALAAKHFRIAGHTDATGSRQVNLALSRQRAQALATFLVASGLDKSRFKIVGYGSDHPLPGTPATHSANRRVEITAID